MKKEEAIEYLKQIWVDGRTIAVQELDGVFTIGCERQGQLVTWSGTSWENAIGQYWIEQVERVKQDHLLKGNDWFEKRLGYIEGCLLERRLPVPEEILAIQ